jgi:hypothetical protein
MAAGKAGRGHLRASHADREHVIGMLKTAFVQGRLTKDELDARVGAGEGLRSSRSSHNRSGPSSAA